MTLSNIYTNEEGKKFSAGKEGAALMYLHAPFPCSQDATALEKQLTKVMLATSA